MNVLCHVDILIQRKLQIDLRLPQKWRQHENSQSSSGTIWQPMWNAAGEPKIIPFQMKFSEQISHCAVLCCESSTPQDQTSAVRQNVPQQHFLSNIKTPIMRTHHSTLSGQKADKIWVFYWDILWHISQGCWWLLQLSGASGSTATFHTHSLARRECNR